MKKGLLNILGLLGTSFILSNSALSQQPKSVAENLFERYKMSIPLEWHKNYQKTGNFKVLEDEVYGEEYFDENNNPRKVYIRCLVLDIDNNNTMDIVEHYEVKVDANETPISQQPFPYAYFFYPNNEILNEEPNPNAPDKPTSYVEPIKIVDFKQNGLTGDEVEVNDFAKNLGKYYSFRKDINTRIFFKNF